MKASTHFIYGRKEVNVLFNDALNTFYLPQPFGTPVMEHWLE